MIDDALKSLINKGVVEEIIVNGEPTYKLTPVGMQVIKHMTSDPSVRN